MGRLRSRGSYKGCVLAFFLADEEGSPLRVPCRVGATKPRWPFQLEIGRKCGLNLQRLLGLDVQQNHGSRFVDRNAQRLSHPERIPDIQNRCRLRTNRQRTCQALGGKGSISNMKREVKLTEDFHRINPCLQATGLVPEQSRTSSHHWEKLPGADRAR